MQVQRHTPINENGERVGKDTFTFVRDYWQEWFMFVVDESYLRTDMPKPLGYSCVRFVRLLDSDGDCVKLVFDYWVFPLSVFMWIFYKLS